MLKPDSDLDSVHNVCEDCECARAATVLILKLLATNEQLPLSEQKKNKNREEMHLLVSGITLTCEVFRLSTCQLAVLS